MKLNNGNNYESIMVYLSKEKTPIAWYNRVNSIVIGGATREEAEKMANEPIELELYYDTSAGLFAVESEAVDSGLIYNPYTAEELEDE